MSNENKNTEKLDIIIPSLKNKDRYYSKLSYRLQFLYLILIPIYVIVFTLDLVDEFSCKSLVSGLCYVLSLGIFLYIFRKYSKEYRSVDYALPTLVMLKKGAYRYKPFRKETWWAFVAILLIDFSLVLNSHFGDTILQQQLIFLLLIFVSMGVGIAIWWVKYKPLRDKILKMIKEIEG